MRHADTLFENTLVIGADGMLGRAFLELFATRGVRPATALYPSLDLTRPETIAAALAARPRLVINCAAHTDVDGAESNEALATAINGDGVGSLAHACRDAGATLVHFGTDYVFSGDASTPYRVDATIAPAGAYGRSKAVGERALREAAVDHLYLRTSWLYAPWAKNFVRTIAALGRTKPELKVVNDQRGRPTSAEQLAKTTLALLASDARGTYHATDEDECTWFEFAQAIVEGSGGTARVIPCSSDEYPRPAKRPPYSVLDIEPTLARIGPIGSWRKHLADVLARLEP